MATFTINSAEYEGAMIFSSPKNTALMTTLITVKT